MHRPNSAISKNQPVPGWLPLQGAERGLRWAGGLLLAGAMLATPAWLSMQTGPACPFLAVTGLPCPLCGGTRTCAALVRGEWSLAWNTNPGALVLVVWMALLAVQWVAEGVMGRRRQAPWPWMQPWPLRLMGLAVLVAWGIALVRAL